MFDGLNQLIDKANLRGYIAAFIRQVVQPFLRYRGKILRQHLGGFRLVDGGRGTALWRDHIQFLANFLIDDLFIKSRLQHTDHTFFCS